jgi:hypothetical protein
MRKYIPIDELDRQLIEDVFLVKLNKGLDHPLDITLLSIKYNPDGDIIGTVRIPNSTLEMLFLPSLLHLHQRLALEMLDMLLPMNEYTNLHRQKKLKQIGI